MEEVTQTDGRLRRSAATRAALVKAARTLFVRHGYGEVSTADVVAQAGMTRNALYYHFATKEQLFRAVYEDVEREIAERILPAALAADSIVEGLRKGSHLFLDACLDPAVAEISVRQAPAVLAFPAMRQIDNANYLGVLTDTIRAGVTSGALRPVAPAVAASMLLGALDEAALVIANAKQPRRARREAGAVVDALLDGLLPRS